MNDEQWNELTLPGSQRLGCPGVVFRCIVFTHIGERQKGCLCLRQFLRQGPLLRDENPTVELDAVREMERMFNFAFGKRYDLLLRLVIFLYRKTRVSRHSRYLPAEECTIVGFAHWRQVEEHRLFEFLRSTDFQD